tara:strand:- start:548 stop:1468 length:921 start_codon:yes stop_codon:yes gene_type:complete
MANYSFLKEAKVYIVSGNTKLQIDISSISFSQTFTEQTRSVKTLHDQTNWFEGSVINSANPANFELRTNLLIEDDTRITFDRMLAGMGFDLYIKTAAVIEDGVEVSSTVFKLDDCVITNGQINIERLRPLSLSISGEATKLLTGQSLPSGMVLRTSDSPRTYNLCPELTVTLDGADISSELRSLSMELQHEVNWTNYKTVNNAIAGTTQYPSGFKFGNKTLAGNITRYLTDTNDSTVQSFGLNKALRIKAGTTIASTFFGVDLNTTNCTFTNRANAGDVFTQNVDWRMAQNTGGNIASVLTYTTQS